MQTYSNRTFTEIVKEHTNIINCEFIDCIFENCKFLDCIFIGCTFSGCKFIDSSITNMQTKETHMLFNIFSECTLVGIQWTNLQSGSISFPIQKLNKCYLKYNNFENMNFKKFDFIQSSILESVFENCNLAESNFKNCELKNTEFSGCDLRKSDFRKATGYNINLATNRIKGARFSYPEVINLLNPFEIVIEK